MGSIGDEETISMKIGSDASAYDIWRARKDIERLAFGFRSKLAEIPPELERLEQFLHRLSTGDC